MVSRSLGANPDDLKDPIKISIPRYVLCGQGKDAHFEFEVKVRVALLSYRTAVRGVQRALWHFVKEARATPECLVL